MVMPGPPIIFIRGCKRLADAGALKRRAHLLSFVVHPTAKLLTRSLATSGGLKRTKGGGIVRGGKGAPNRQDRRKRPSKRRSEAPDSSVDPSKNPVQKQQQQQSSSSSSSSQSQHWTNDPERLWNYRKKAWPALAQRATPLVILAGIVTFSEDANHLFYSYLCPIQIEQLSGPSMLPSIHPYGDTWLHTTPLWDSIRQVYHSVKGAVLARPSPLYERGQLVIWRDPNNNNKRTCKRIVGMEGDTVQRYGQFAEYYRHRSDLGVRWETLSARGLDPSCPWDTDSTEVDFNNQGTVEEEKPRSQEDMSRTLVVPKGHVWLEGDNPLLSVDSRHYGPVPEAYLEGKLVWRMWPLLRHPAIRRHDQMLLKHRNIRPQPLDVETPKQRGKEDRLALYYNLHRPRNRLPPSAETNQAQSLEGSQHTTETSGSN